MCKLMIQTRYYLTFICAPILALSVDSANATLANCVPPDQGAYSVFLSEPQYTSAAFEDREDMLKVFDRLQLHLDQRQDEEMAGITSDVNFRVARCENRVPALDGGDFTDDVVRNLYTRAVVVEIWGKLDAKRVNGAPLDPEAQMNYLIVPIKRGSVSGSDPKLGIQRFTYPDGEIFATDFVDLISNMDLHAFVATGIGVTAFDAEEYAVAHQMLCLAHAQLGKTAHRLAATPSTVPQSEKIESLRVFLKSLASRTIVKAKSLSPGNPPTFAILQSPDNPCPGQGDSS